MGDLGFMHTSFLIEQGDCFFFFFPGGGEEEGERGGFVSAMPSDIMHCLCDVCITIFFFFRDGHAMLCYTMLYCMGGLWE